VAADAVPFKDVLKSYLRAVADEDLRLDAQGSGDLQKKLEEGDLTTYEALLMKRRERLCAQAQHPPGDLPFAPSTYQAEAATLTDIIHNLHFYLR